MESYYAFVRNWTRVKNKAEKSDPDFFWIAIIGEGKTESGKHKKINEKK